MVSKRALLIMMPGMDIIIMYHYHTKEAKAVIDPGLSLRILMEVDCCLQLIMMSRKVAVYAVVVAVVLQISSPPNTSN